MDSDEQLADILSEFAHTMLTDFPIQRILDHLVQRIVEMMPVDGAGVITHFARRQPTVHRRLRRNRDGL